MSSTIIFSDLCEIIEMLFAIISVQGSSSCLCSMSILILHSKMFIAGAQWLVHLTSPVPAASDFCQGLVAACQALQHTVHFCYPIWLCIIVGFLKSLMFLLNIFSFYLTEYAKKKKTQRQIKVFLKASSQCKKKNKKLYI